MKKNVITKIAEISETDPNLVKPDTELMDLESWDSLANVTFVAYAISEYGVKLTADEMLDAKTVSDLIRLVESKLL
ncbi:MAG: acyl carrier protein [Cloacibacillus sp.]